MQNSSAKGMIKKNSATNTVVLLLSRTFTAIKTLTCSVTAPVAFVIYDRVKDKLCLGFSLKGTVLWREAFSVLVLKDYKYKNILQ